MYLCDIFLIIDIKFILISGDGDYKPYVSSDPDVTTVEMNGSEDFIIIACDGLWDTVTPMSATSCVYKQLLQTEKGKWNQHYIDLKDSISQNFVTNIRKIRI